MTWESQHIPSRNTAGGLLMPRMKTQPASAWRNARDAGDTDTSKIKNARPNFWPRFVF
jgi:hypothetical protein